MRGHKVYDPPLWLLVLEAAQGDPLRAQVIEAELSRVWWERWLIYRQEQGKAIEIEERKARR